MKVTLLTLVLLLTSCGKFSVFNRTSQQKQNVSKIYASGKLTIAVFYEQGAEPYTDTVSPVPGFPAVKVWDVLESNLKAMFPGKTITVPKDLVEMAKINDQNQTTWTINEVKSLGDSLGQPSVNDTTVLNVFFVNGYADGGSNVIGQYILPNTRTIVIYKDVVVASSSGTNSAATQRYVEQATIVHEVGHAVGLVNSGIPMTSSHEDPAHAPHCNNPDCVMYYKNEGTADLVGYITNHLLKLNPVMFDSACLNDVTSYK